jgi:dolichol-phosphate mannosyltransferase
MTVDESAAPTISQVIKVAVVIPTYNEADNLPRLVTELAALGIDGLGFVIVDDGSPDGTGDVADRLASEFIRKSNGVFEVIHRERKEGLGRSYVAGFTKALELGVEYVVQMDADLSHPPVEVPAMLAALDEADIVTGSRYAVGGGVDPSWSFLRRQISYWGGVGIRLLLGLKVKDSTSGFKAFRRSALETIGIDTLKLSGYGFQPEVTYRAQKAGLRVAEHPFLFMDRTAGESKMSVGIVAEAIYRLILIRLRG